MSQCPSCKHDNLLHIKMKKAITGWDEMSGYLHGYKWLDITATDYDTRQCCVEYCWCKYYDEIKEELKKNELSSV